MEAIGEIIGHIFLGFIEYIFHCITTAIYSAIAWVYLRIRYRTQAERDAAVQKEADGSLSRFAAIKISDFFILALLVLPFLGVGWLIFFIIKDTLINF